jgi:hypothetical protein
LEKVGAITQKVGAGTFQTGATVPEIGAEGFGLGAAAFQTGATTLKFGAIIAKTGAKAALAAVRPEKSGKDDCIFTATGGWLRFTFLIPGGAHFSFFDFGSAA